MVIIMNYMNYKSILLTLALLLFVKILLSFITNKKTKLPPGPPALPFIGHLHLIKNMPLHHALVRISERYGPMNFLRFGSYPVLHVSSYSLAKECLTTHDLAFCNRPHLPSAKDISLDFTAIGLANYGPYWQNVRRIVAMELLSPLQLQASSDVRASEVHDLARRIFVSWRASSNGSEGLNDFKKLEVRKKMFELSLNVMMTMIAGKRFYGDNIKHLEETDQFRETIKELFLLSAASNIADFLPIFRLVDLEGVMRRKKHIAKVNNEFTQKLIDEHRSEDDGKGKKKTMIAELLELQKKDPVGYSDKIIQAICISLLQAGTDSSSNAVEWTLSILLNNPEIMEKAMAEIEAQVGYERLVEESDLPNLPYLHCIIMEVLRFVPGGPLLIPHQSREQVSIGGYTIPPGTMLLLNVYYVHRDPEIWEEPTKFKPERFLNMKNGGEKSYALFTFGMGRRKCPGEALGMRELGLILGTLIQCFEWRRIGDELVDLTEGFGLAMPKAIPLEALYRPRQAMAKVLSELQAI